MTQPAAAKHTYQDAEAIIGFPEHYLSRNLDKLPHTRIGRLVRFTDAQLAEIVAMHERRPDGTRPIDDLRPAGGGRRRKAG
jgi:hypothetical protein